MRGRVARRGRLISAMLPRLCLFDGSSVRDSVTART